MEKGEEVFTATTPASKIYPPKRRFTRRKVLIGLGALGAVGVGGGIWRIYAPIRGLVPILMYQGYENALAWSPDSRGITFGADDNAVQVWDTTTNSHLLTYRGHGDPVKAVAWSPDGKSIASSSEDFTVQVWSATTGQRHVTYQGDSDWINAIAWSPDSRRIAFIDDDIIGKCYSK